MLEDMKTQIETIAEVLEQIGEIIYVLKNPIIIWNWFMDISYWIAALICVFSIVFYASTGSNKMTRIMWLTISAYLLLKGVDMAI